MSKRFKGKTCVYCAGEGISSTGDHIFAREFLPINKRDGLPIVAACEACNNAKSKLEHYLTAVMPFGGQHADSTAMLVNDVPRRLAKNNKLYEQLRAGSGTFSVDVNGKSEEHYGVPFDSEKLVRLFAYIARGLVAHHWAAVIPSRYETESLLLNPFYEPHFRELFLRPARRRVQGMVGDGAFLYEGVQAVDDLALTIWRFQAFGGMIMTGDSDVPGPSSPTFWVTTARHIPRV